MVTTLYPDGRPLWHRLALPTWGIVTLVYGGWGLTTWFYHDLPWWLVLPLGGYFVCLHGSLQHEAVHGRPTGVHWIDGLIVFPSLWLWLPFTHYRESHIALLAKLCSRARYTWLHEVRALLEPPPMSRSAASLAMVWNKA